MKITVKFDIVLQTFATKFAVDNFRLHSHMNVTLKKISEVLDISISTVSRALKNHPDISSATKQKVTELAAVLDYEPNANAINLRSQNSRVFGLMVPSVANSFYDSFMAALEERCRLNSYSLIIMQSADDPEIEQNILKIYRQNRVSGCFACLSPGNTDLANFKKLEDLSIPIVFFDKVPDETTYNQVCIDNETAASQVAEALIKKGKKRILSIFGNEDFALSRIRREAFVRSFQKEGNCQLFNENASSSDAAAAITQQYFRKKSKPDAVFCMSDEILIGVMKTIQRLKLSYPEEIGIISMSDGYYPKLYYPEVTYIETSGYKLGALAYDVMMQSMEDHHTIHQLTVAPVLVTGGSL